jgi:hypothetical protein
MTDHQYGDYEFEIYFDGVEGIQHCDEVGSAKDYGVEGTYCPNHGGRRANGGLPAPRLRSLEPT